jgi:hypothetical protein
LVLTLALHAGIAWASSSSETTAANAKDKKNSKGSCDAGGEEVEDLTGQEGDPGIGGAPGQNNPARAPL